MLLREAEIAGRGICDVRIRAGRIAALAPRLAPRPGEAQFAAAGGALLPGLHDHHLHLLALAAARQSLRCGPPEIADESALRRALADAKPRRGWLRGHGYCESVAGELDRWRLDGLAPSAPPLRIQHRSGALWMLNSAALRALGLDSRAAHFAGVERDASGRATGRLFRADGWLRARLGPAPPPDLAPVGAALARCGITGVTDATPDNGPEAVALIAAAQKSGALPQRVWWMGGARLPAGGDGAPRPLKLLLDDWALPAPEALARRVAWAHAAGRPVAIHCVTRAELAVACAAIEQAGALRGDRLEHAAVAPPELAAWVRRLGLAVVTQPNFVSERGDDYLREVAARDQPWLWRCRGWDELGVPLGGGSDAPFGSPDVWAAMAAATTRRTARGAVLGPGEALRPERALRLFTTPPESPGGAPRHIDPGAPADLCLLRPPWREARESLCAAHVRATWRTGKLIWSAEG
ncbi:MAG: amidohydrolase family protein [Deltaproteobacteria bacterium]|nr:amidohydrolase family protein [Deltaproteobacteria bacterium]